MLAVGFSETQGMLTKGATPLPRIGLVATDALRIAGLQVILGDGERFTVAVQTGAEAVEDSAEVVVIDSSATGHLFDLIGLFRRTRPQVAVIVLGAETDFEHIERVIGAGARGYLNLAVNEAELRMAVDVVRDGSVWAPRKVMARLLASSLEEGGAAAGGVRFTRREQEVLRLLVQGQSNREMAQAMGVDEGSIKAHMGRLMRKAGVDNRTALSMRAIERKWA